MQAPRDQSVGFTLKSHVSQAAKCELPPKIANPALITTNIPSTRPEIHKTHTPHLLHHPTPSAPPQHPLFHPGKSKSMGIALAAQSCHVLDI